MEWKKFRKEWAKYKLVKGVILSYPGVNPDEQRLMRNLKEQFEDHAHGVQFNAKIGTTIVSLAAAWPYIKKNRGSLRIRHFIGVSFVFLTVVGLANKWVLEFAGFNKTDYFYEELMKSSQPISEFIKNKT